MPYIKSLKTGAIREMSEADARYYLTSPDKAGKYEAVESIPTPGQAEVSQPDFSPAAENADKYSAMPGAEFREPMSQFEKTSQDLLNAPPVLVPGLAAANAAVPIVSKAASVAKSVLGTAKQQGGNFMRGLNTVKKELPYESQMLNEARVNAADAKLALKNFIADKKQFLQTRGESQFEAIKASLQKAANEADAEVTRWGSDVANLARAEQLGGQYKPFAEQMGERVRKDVATWLPRAAAAGAGGAGLYYMGKKSAKAEAPADTTLSQGYK